MARSNAAVKVGTVVLLAFATLAGLAYFFFGRTVGGYLVDVQFEDAQGITQQADVLLSGVKIGSVQDIRLGANNRPILRLAIRPEYRIPIGSTYTLSSSGLLGELSVMIAPPVRAAGHLPRRHDDPPFVQGKDLVTIDDLKEQLATLGEGTQEVMDNLKTATENVARLSGDPVLHNAIRNSAANAETISRQGLLAMADVRGAISDVRRTVGGLTGEIDRSMVTVNQALRQVELASRQGQPIAAETRAAIRAARELLSQFGETNVFLREMVQDIIVESEPGPALKTALANLAVASEQFKAVAESARKISDDLVGTDETSTRVGGVVNEVGQLAGRANELLEKLTGVTDRASRPRGRLINARGQVDATQKFGDDSRFRVDANLAILRENNSAVILGLVDIGEGNRLNLQYSTPVTARARMRYGFIGSKLGMGVDWNLYENPVTPLVANPPGARSLSLNLYDPNDAQLDIYARHQINDRLGLTAGFEDVFDGTNPMIGLSYRP